MKLAELIGIATLIIAVGAFLYTGISDLRTDISDLRTDVRLLQEASIEHSKALGMLGGELKGLAQGLSLHGHRDGNIIVVQPENETSEAVDVLEYLDDVPKKLGQGAEDAVKDTVEAAEDTGKAVVEGAKDVGKFIRNLF